VFPPALGSWDDLELAVDPIVERLLDARVSRVPRVARRVDRASYRILGPRLGPSAAPTQSGG
jgi:hypothetical protein